MVAFTRNKAMVDFTRVVGSKHPAPDGATVDVTEYSHTGPPITETREIVARKGMVIHAAEVSGQMWNDNGRHASCNVELCPAAGSTRDRVVIKSTTSRNILAGKTKLLWTATVTFVPEVTRPPLSMKLRHAMRFSILCYAEKEDLKAWREGGTTKEVPLTDCTSFKPDEVEPVHLALEGEDAESGTHRMAQWLMAKADGVLYVAFKGTTTLKDALLDTQLHSIELDSGVRLHSGFNTRVNDEVKVILAKCQEERSNVQRVVLTGHSLGGAYAIAALLKLSGAQDLPPLAFEAITFGAPLVVVSPPSEVPPILNVVANYDIVPRLLAMPDGQVDSFLTHIPDLITNGSWLRAMPVRVVLPEAKRFTRELNDLRRRYRPVGTFVFAQSHVEGEMRRTSATVVPSDDAAGILKQFPDVKRVNELAFAQECLADHSPTGYWRIVKALCEALWDGKDQEFASFAADPKAKLSRAGKRPCDWNFQERAIVNWLDREITIVTEKHSFDVASEREVSLTPLGIGTKITVSSTLFGETKWNIDVPSGGLLIHESHVLGYVARTYSVTDDGWEMGPVVSPHEAHGIYVDQLAAHLVRRYPEGATVRRVTTRWYQRGVVSPRFHLPCREFRAANGAPGHVQAIAFSSGSRADDA